MGQDSPSARPEPGLWGPGVDELLASLPDDPPDQAGTVPDAPRSKAEQIIETSDLRAIIRMAMGARIAADEGRYCECAEPSLRGMDLMCGACLLNNRGQEIRRIHRSVDAHGHVPGKLGGYMCATCTQGPNDPRHHGQPAVGRTSWGTSVQGV